MVEPFFVSFFIKWLQLHNPNGIYLRFVFVIGLFFSASFFNIMAISVDRLLAVQFHLRYQALVTHKRVVGVIIFIWTFSVFSFLMLYSRQSCQVLEPFASSSLQWSIAGSILLHHATKDKFSKYKNWRHKLHKIARWGIFQGWWKLLSVFYTFTLRFWFVIFPRFILSAARVITGPNIVIASFSLCRHTLTFFNSLLNPVIYGWRMRQIRHALMDSLRKVYTNRKLWFWTVRPSH